MIGHTPSTLLQRAAVDGRLCQRRHREGALLGRRRLLDHRPPRHRGVLFHPHREVRGIGRVVHLRRQLIAGCGQRRVHPTPLEHFDRVLAAFAVLRHRRRHQVVVLGSGMRRHQPVAVDDGVLRCHGVEKGCDVGVGWPRRASRLGGARRGRRRRRFGRRHGAPPRCPRVPPCRPLCRTRRSSRVARRGSRTAGPPTGLRCRRTLATLR